MKKLLQKILLAAGAAVTMGSASALASNATMMDYLDEVSGYIPNKLNISLSQELRYNDNIHSSTRGQETGSLISDTSLTADVHRSIGKLSYGVAGTISYNYYFKDSSESSAWDWNISPRITGQLFDIQNLMVSFTSTSELEPLDDSNTNYARHYTNGIHLAYDYTRHAKWGIMVTSDYENEYYPQDEFSDCNNQSISLNLSPYYNVSSRLRAGLTFGYTRTFYDNDKVNNDSDEYSLSIFGDYRLNQFFSFFGSVGMSKTKYEDEGEDSNGDDELSPTYTVGMKYIASKRMSFTLKSSLEMDDSFSSRGGENVCDTCLTANYRLNPKIYFSQSVGLDHTNQLNSDFDTDKYYYKLRANYLIKDGLTTYFGYEYTDTKFKYEGGRDYKENEVTVGISVAF